MTHDERIERIARAITIADKLAPDPDAPILIGMRSAKAWEGRIPQAEAAYRATLEAIREPSMEMRNAGSGEFLHGGHTLAIWHAMIDAALNAKPTVEDERIAAMEGK